MSDGNREKLDDLRRKMVERKKEMAATGDIENKIHCGDGWRTIVDDFVRDGLKYDGFGLISAGEKWGILNLHYTMGRGNFSAIADLDKQAVERSSHTCEMCGQPGILRREGWRKTLCDRHDLQRHHIIPPEEFDRLMPEFSAGGDRWQPLVASFEDTGQSEDEIFDHFFSAFGDLEPDVRKFWTLNCANFVVEKRRRQFND